MSTSHEKARQAIDAWTKRTLGGLGQQLPSDSREAAIWDAAYEAGQRDQNKRDASIALACHLGNLSTGDIVEEIKRRGLKP